MNTLSLHFQINHRKLFFDKFLYLKILKSILKRLKECFNLVKTAMFENLLSINCIKPNVLCIDYSDDGSKVFLGISFNLGSEPERNIIFYILDGSNGSLVGKSIRSDKLRVAQVRNYQVEDFVYSVFT